MQEAPSARKIIPSSDLVQSADNHMTTQDWLKTASLSITKYCRGEIFSSDLTENENIKQKVTAG